MKERNTASNQVPTLVPVTKWGERHLWPSVSQLRWLIFSGDEDFQRCVLKVGRRVLIDESKFFEWVEKQNQCGQQLGRR